MTLPLHKNPPTTPRNTPRLIPHNRTGLFTALLFLAIAQAAGAQGQNAIPPEDFSSAGSLESLKKRSPVSHWKTIKSSSRSSNWNSVPAPDSLRTKRGNQPVFQQSRPVGVPEARLPAHEELRVFNPSQQPARISERSSTLPVQSEPAAPSLNDSFSAEPFEVPSLSEATPSELNQSEFPAPSEFKRPILRPNTQPLPATELNNLTQQPGEQRFFIPRRTASISQAERDQYTPAPLQKITDISPFADYTPKGSKTGGSVAIPEVQRLDKVPYSERNFEETVYTWEPTNLSYNPLYFEDPALERYGHTYHPALQPFVSTARFGIQLVGLPYQMTIDPIYKRRYTLGYYRPGEWAPKKLYQIPLNLDAAIVEGGALTGAFFLFP